MYLSRVTIQNFRCFDEKGIEVEFLPGINVIIGENNCGKTALIDALRIAFSLGSSGRDIYVNLNDFHLKPDGVPANQISIDLYFSNLSLDEEAGFYDLLVLGSSSTAQLHLRYIRETVKGAIERVRLTMWGGEKEGQSISSASLDLINHIFLGALRDAERHLKPGRENRLGRLIKNIVVDDKDRRRIVSHVRKANREILKEKMVNEASEIINYNLSEIEGKRLNQQIQISFMQPDFDRVVDSLLPLLPHNDFYPKAVYTNDEWKNLVLSYSKYKTLIEQNSKPVDGKVFVNISSFSPNNDPILDDLLLDLKENMVGLFSVDQNGLGFNNLIYMGTVLGDLQKLKDLETESYNALLIEEPEAHLHPQLQNLVFDFLGRVSSHIIADNNQNRIRTEPQIFITTHSPTLTSRAPLDRLILLYKVGANTLATSIRSCPLEDPYKIDLERYIDVTKAQLFFAKGVLLVEGISEALLLPIFADRLNRRLDHNAVEVVIVSGTSFSPFAKLFNAECTKKRLEIPCAILTDDDRGTGKTDPNFLKEEDTRISFAYLKAQDIPKIVLDLNKIREKLKNGLEADRARRVRDLVGGNLKAFFAYKTFEYELALKPENQETMLLALELLSLPEVAKGLRELFKSDLLDKELKAISIWLAVRNTKAEFAQKLAAVLQDKVKPFVVPDYIQHAINHVAPVKTM